MPNTKKQGEIDTMRTMCKDDGESEREILGDERDKPSGITMTVDIHIGREERELDEGQRKDDWGSRYR